jgi:hypothetical protein
MPDGNCVNTGPKAGIMSAVDKLSAELAFKANVDAVSRDYVCEPHVGTLKQQDLGLVNSQTTLITLSRPTVVPDAYDLSANALCCISQSTGLFLESVGRWWWQMA